MIGIDDRKIHQSSNDADPAVKTSSETMSSFILKSSIIAALFCCLSTTSEAQEAIHKMGSCPYGYRTSGNYCVPSSSNAKHAIFKNGACPAGYRTSGNYCLSNR